MRTSFLLIDNPFAGHGSRRLVDEVVAGLARRGARVSRMPAAHLAAAHAATLDAARAGAFDAVVAAGGDGTIRRAAALMMGSPTPLGVIPLGTGNVLAHEAALPRDPASIARLLMGGEARNVPLAAANGAPFLLMVGAGFDGRVIAGLDQGLKSRLGKLAYAPPVLSALVPPPSLLRVTVDGVTYAAEWAVITKSRCYGGRFVIAEAGGVEKPGLLAVLIEAMSRVELAATLLALATGTLAARRNVRVIPCRRAVIEASEPVPVQVDGDAFGTSPVDVVADHGSVSMILPPPAIVDASLRRAG